MIAAPGAPGFSFFSPNVPNSLCAEMYNWKRRFLLSVPSNVFDRSHRNSRPKVKMKHSHSRTSSTLS
jgi:hypothetical protein